MFQLSVMKPFRYSSMPSTMTVSLALARTLIPTYLRRLALFIQLQPIRWNNFVTLSLSSLLPNPVGSQAKTSYLFPCLFLFIFQRPYSVFFRWNAFHCFVVNSQLPPPGADWSNHLKGNCERRTAGWRPDWSAERTECEQDGLSSISNCIFNKVRNGKNNVLKMLIIRSLDWIHMLCIWSRDVSQDKTIQINVMDNRWQNVSRTVSTFPFFPSALPLCFIAVTHHDR